MTSVTVRQARADDAADVRSFTRDTWIDREVDDYIPRVFDEWVRTDGPDQRTFVAEIDGRVVGLAQSVLLSEDEAWSQGLRVAADVRGRAVGSKLSRAAQAWARERGATVTRGMVFSWNVMGLGHARTNGFDAVTEFRWAHPTPDEGADPALDSEFAPGFEEGADPAAAWRFWTDSDARTHLAGLALSTTESWALCELTRETLRESAAEDGLFVVSREGTRGVAFRTREIDIAGEGEREERLAEYGVAAWDTPNACEALMRAIARDAGERGADRTRVLIPETARHVSDVAAARVAVADDPDFVLAADLTDGTRFG
ncbi:GNAT family N-acetyltransferase [Salinigranum rubrum]|uniref:GNAT family N-acetyltransferase n=1 Tax=Salinigranum rubrum TaxID=755307 RepID=A0A2I8VL72_9EURY|nr:GNAT family N-acetyltransferase [Salinigranum rubrum]AUV82677.1 GNAT family N-acetyltransferase [Salinigranum rubrum]